MNVSLSSRHSVHATRKGRTGPACHASGASHNSELYKATAREVTCKKCLKWLADEAEAEAAYQARLAASMMPSADFHATPETAGQDDEIIQIREAAEAEAGMLRAGAEELRTRADEVETPAVTGLDGRPAVWMVQHENRTMWIAEGVPGLFVSEARATAALSRRNTTATAVPAKPSRAATRIRRAVNLKW